jgi:hypothetical protein
MGYLFGQKRRKVGRLQRQAVKGVHDLALRLRVSPRARLSKVNARMKASEPVSYYDRVRLEQGNAKG